MIRLFSGGGDTPEINRQEATTMSTMEVLTLGILLVNVIGLVFTITRKDR